MYRLFFGIDITTVENTKFADKSQKNTRFRRHNIDKLAGHCSTDVQTLQLDHQSIRLPSLAPPCIWVCAFD